MTNGAARPLDITAMVKEAGLTAIVVFGLAFALVGFKTEDVSGGIDILFRFDAVTVAVVIAFVGRIFLILLREDRPLPVLYVAGLYSFTLLASLGLNFLPADYELSQPLADALSMVRPFDAATVNWMVLIVAVSLTVRAGLLVRHINTDLSPEDREKSMDNVGARFQGAEKYIVPVLLVLAISFPFMPIADRHLIDIGVLVITYIMLGWGLNIVVGLAGLLDLGYVAFYAVGAYSYALLAQYFGFGFWISLPLAGILAAFAGILLGFPVLRLRGDYLAIVTLGFGEIVRIILINWYDFTNGPDGVSGIPRPTFFGLPFKRNPSEDMDTFHSFFNLTFSSTDRIIFLYYLILIMALITNAFTMRIRKLPIGRAWEALREDEIATRSLGINPTNTKLTAFSIGAMFAGFAGSFFATRQGFISPESFTFIESAVILAIVVLGGMGSQLGVVFAAVLLIGLPEFFRELQDYRMLAFGGAMVLIMIWRPKGLLAHREPTIRLHPKGDPPPNDGIQPVAVRDPAE